MEERKRKRNIEGNGEPETDEGRKKKIIKTWERSRYSRKNGWRLGVKKS